MSFAFFVFSLLIGLNAVAQSKVGDWASYKINSVTAAGEIRSGTETVKVLKINKKTEQLLLHTIVIEENGPYRLDEQTWQDSADFVDAEVGQAYLDQCSHEDIGGVLETVTVPAGTLPACKVLEPAGISGEWYGAVPFGLVKSVYVTEWPRGDRYIPVTLTKELLDFRK